MEFQVTPEQVAAADPAVGAGPSAGAAVKAALAGDPGPLSDFIARAAKRHARGLAGEDAAADAALAELVRGVIFKVELT